MAEMQVLQEQKPANVPSINPAIIIVGLLLQQA
jgi:hypothetical protein